MRRTRPAPPRAPLPGSVLAGVTATVSGVSVLVNSYAVHDFPDAVAYTTEKGHLVAALVLAFAALALGRRRLAPRAAPPVSRFSQLAALAYVGVVGGGLAFGLFFTGLSRTAAVPAAFLHDTLVVWVAIAAGAVLHERLRPANFVALAALVVGAVALSGGIGGLSLDSGTALVLAATLLWAGEVLVAKRLLELVPASRLAVVRMGGGGVALLGWCALDGRLGALGGLSLHQIGWLLLTGALLAGYVATWFAALARARAIDVTSVLVASAGLTAVLEAALGRASFSAMSAVGLALVGVGVALCYARWPRRAVT